MKNSDFKLYSLLHVDLKNRHKNVNLNSHVENPIDVYINCGRLLAESCRYFNVSYAIVTNEGDFVRSRVEALGGGVEIIAGDFDRSVPGDVAFHSAHFKLDLLRAFGNGDFGTKVGLIDLDVVLTKPVDFGAFFEGQESLLVYDISSEERASYGDERIAKSLRALGASVENHAYWYGGEFIAGRKELFDTLSKEVDRIWPAYMSEYRSLHHMGDEMVVTAALNALVRAGVCLVDAGRPLKPSGAPLVARWWSGRTLCEQSSFSAASGAAFLHLPADKPFLAKMAARRFSPEVFLQEYRRYAGIKLLYRKLLNPFLNIKEGRRFFVANMR